MVTVGAGTELDARPRARAVIGIAQDLGLRVVAEGVETRATLDVLRAWGCDEVQGCFTGRPMRGDALAQAHRNAADAGAGTR